MERLVEYLVGNGENDKIRRGEMRGFGEVELWKTLWKVWKSGIVAGIIQNG